MKIFNQIKYIFFLPLFIVVAVAFFFVSSCFAVDTLDDFESYTLGNLEGQDGWATSPDNAWDVVESSNCYGNTGKCIKTVVENKWSRKIYSIASSTGWMSFKFKITQLDVDLSQFYGGMLRDAQDSNPGTPYWALREFDSTHFTKYDNTSIKYDINTWYELRVEWDLSGWEMTVNGNSYASSTSIYKFTGITLGQQNMSTGDIYVDNIEFWATDVDFDDPDDVEIIELPDMGEVTVQTGAEQFTYEKDTFCYIGNSTCDIRINYSYDDIGSLVLLLPEDATSTLSYVDVIYELEDKDALRDTLQPTIRNEEIVDNYYIFLSPSTGSSTLYTDISVHWISSTSDIAILSGVMTYFKNVFPLSLFFQIKGAFDYVKDRATIEEVDYKLNDLVPSEYSGYVGNETILNKSILETKLPIWSTHIYPLLQQIIYIMTLILSYFMLKGVFDNEEE